MNEETQIEFYGENSYNNVATEIDYIDILQSGKEVKLELRTHVEWMKNMNQSMNVV